MSLEAHRDGKSRAQYCATASTDLAQHRKQPAASDSFEVRLRRACGASVGPFAEFEVVTPLKQPKSGYWS